MKVEIDEVILSEKEVELLKELIILGFDGMVEDWTEEEEKIYRVLLDKYNIN